MAPILRSRTLYYKRCRIDDAAAPLSTLLAAAIATAPTAMDRMQPSWNDPNSHTLINETIEKHGYVFGNIVEWTQGRDQPVISVEPGRRSLEVSLLKADERQEFLEGMGHFLAFKNHLVFARGKAIGSGTIERHLEWLLRDRARLIQPESSLFLLDAPQKPGSPVARVKSLTLSPAPIDDPKKKSGYAVASIATRNDITRALIDRLIQMRLLRLGEEDVNELLAARNVRASIKLSYSKSTKDDSEQILDVLGAALRHADGDWGFQLDIPGVGKMHDGMLTLKHVAQLPHSEGLDPDDSALANEMWSWLKQLLARNEVTSEV